MATFPLITAPFPTNIDENDDDLDSSESDDEPFPATFDIGDFDESDEEDENGEESDDETMPFSDIQELTRLTTLKKPTGAFPFPATQPTTPFPVTQPTTPFPVTQPTAPFPMTRLTAPFPMTRPTVPVPTTQPRVPVPTQAGLRLNLMPTTGQAPMPTLRPPVPTPTAPTMRSPIIPMANIPNIPMAGTRMTPTVNPPNVPALGGLVAPQKALAPQLPAQPAATTLDVNAILTNMPGITVSTVTPPPGHVPADINDLLKKETDETTEDFEARRRLTLQLASIPDYKLNNVAAVTAGLIMMKKSKLGVSYDPDVEAAITYLTALLNR